MAKKYISLGKLQKEFEAAIESQPGQKKRTIFPSFYLDSSEVNIPNEKIGNEFEAEVKLYVRSKKVNDDHLEHSKKFNYEFEVRAIRMPKKENKRGVQQAIEEGLEEEKGK